jgi:hypothetical protein
MDRIKTLSVNHLLHLFHRRRFCSGPKLVDPSLQTVRDHMLAVYLLSLDHLVSQVRDPHHKHLGALEILIHFNRSGLIHLSVIGLGVLACDIHYFPFHGFPG